jgi:tryptophan-rich sensory protein
LATESGESAWYLGLNKPAWNPPSFVFAPVWTALYTLMGIAAWRVWRHGGFARQAGPLSLFLVQLGLNGAWSLIFFGAHAPTWALLEIAALWVAIVLTIGAFRRIDAVAASLLLPYLAWVTFATALNAAIVRLN